MAHLVSKRLPRRLLSYLRAESEGRFSDVILVATTDEQNTPHVAMLSHWEIYAANLNCVNLATYSDSRTTRNMRRSGKVTIIAVNRRLAYYVKGVASLKRDHMKGDRYNSMFAVKVKGVYEDKLPGARILSGITFKKTRRAEPHEALHSELLLS